MLPEKKSQVGKSKIDSSHSKTTFFDEPPWELSHLQLDIPLTAPVLRWNQQATKKVTGFLEGYPPEV